MRVHVEGGTNAGGKPPFNGKPKPWRCVCRMNIGALIACPDCGERRPT